MPGNFPMGVVVLAIGVIALVGNCPTGVMVLRGVVVLMGNCWRGSCPMG